MKTSISTIILYIFIMLLLVLLYVILYFILKRNYALRKIRNMKEPEKIETIQALLSPFGYRYIIHQDLISSHNEAWQRQTGYHDVFDRSALWLHMSFDALPIYYNYRGRTWLIELWKGQYGINTGAEIGIYHADRLLKKDELKTAHYKAVSDAERLPIAFTLYRGKKAIAHMSETSWWLTAFLVGMYSDPASLTLHSVITFPNSEMRHCFLMGLKGAGLSPGFYDTKGNQVHLLFADGCPFSPFCFKNASPFFRLRIHYVNFCNRMYCRLYQGLTKPFQRTLDKILYLYTLLPFTIRRTLRHLRGTRK